MDDIMLRFGVPDIMVSDNGPEYTNALMEALNHIMRIRHIKQSPTTLQQTDHAKDGMAP